MKITVVFEDCHLGKELLGLISTLNKVINKQELGIQPGSADLFKPEPDAEPPAETPKKAPRKRAPKKVKEEKVVEHKDEMGDTVDVEVVETTESLLKEAVQHQLKVLNTDVEVEVDAPAEELVSIDDEPAPPAPPKPAKAVKVPKPKDPPAEELVSIDDDEPAPAKPATKATKAKPKAEKPAKVIPKASEVNKADVSIEEERAPTKDVSKTTPADIAKPTVKVDIPDPSEEPTVDETRNAVLACVSVCTAEPAIAEVKRVAGVSKPSEIPEDKRVAVILAMKAMVDAQS